VDPSEASRRQSVLLHTVLAASLGAYALLLLLLRGNLGAGGAAPAAPSTQNFRPLLLVAAAQLAFSVWLGGAILRSRSSPVLARLRRYFLMRGALAEAIGLYGLLAGVLRAPLLYTVGLFGLAAVALAASAPTRAAWDEAARKAESPAP
jgi:hypothetical protein